LWVKENYPIQEGMKQRVQVNVKMTQDDFELLRKAAEKHWPDADTGPFVKKSPV
jgi:hypothetical protein